MHFLQRIITITLICFISLVSVSAAQDNLDKYECLKEYTPKLANREYGHFGIGTAIGAGLYSGHKIWYSGHKWYYKVLLSSALAGRLFVVVKEVRLDVQEWTNGDYLWDPETRERYFECGKGGKIDFQTKGGIDLIVYTAGGVTGFFLTKLIYKKLILKLF